MVTIEQALEEAKKNHRVCPQPGKWHELYELLPNKVRKGGCRGPALPLILAAWSATPKLSKIVRFHEHLAWATEHGALDAVYEFMQNLEEEEWFHFDE
jgi:hypothetical protein